MENTEHPGLWWPGSAFRQILELTAETCEKFEVGELGGDEAADIILTALNDCESLNPVFGWKGPESTRFIYPSTPMVARFVYWAMRAAPEPEMREISRSLVGSAARSILKGKKPL